MMSFSRARLVAFAAGCVLAAVPASAGAAQPDKVAPSADAAQVADWGSAITEQGVTEVVNGKKIDKPVKDQGDAIAAQGCWYVTWSRWASNIFGQRLFTYYQRLDWCGSNGRIYSPSRTRWPNVSFPGWEFKGHIGTSSRGGSGYSYWRAFTQGSFCLAQYFGCVQNKYPWIDMTVTAYGRVSGSTGGT